MGTLLPDLGVSAKESLLWEARWTGPFCVEPFPAGQPALGLVLWRPLLQPDPACPACAPHLDHDRSVRTWNILPRGPQPASRAWGVRVTAKGRPLFRRGISCELRLTDWVGHKYAWEAFCDVPWSQDGNRKWGWWAGAGSTPLLGATSTKHGLQLPLCFLSPLPSFLPPSLPSFIVVKEHLIHNLLY